MLNLFHPKTLTSCIFEVRARCARRARGIVVRAAEITDVGDIRRRRQERRKEMRGG